MRSRTRAIASRRWSALVYVYDHETRELPKRLTRGFHHHHDLSQATLHVHLDEESCLEVTVLKGKGSEVQSFANQVERGVRHGHVVYIPAPEGMAISHGHSHTHPQVSSHRRPRRGA